MKNILKIILFSFISFLIISCGQKFDYEINENSKILAIGDSLTYGYGAKKSWPEYFEEITYLSVINSGINGNNSEQVFNRIENEINEHHPDIVFLGIGGNDFIQRVEEETTKSNIINIIDIIQNNNAKVILIATPKPSLTGAIGILSDHNIYKEIANEKNILLIEDLWSEILSDQKKKSDPIHANDIGYQEFAQKLVKILEKKGILK